MTKTKAKIRRDLDAHTMDAAVYSIHSELARGATIVADVHNDQGAYLGRYEGSLEEIARELDADWHDAWATRITIDGQPHRYMSGRILTAEEYVLAVGAEVSR